MIPCFRSEEIAQITEVRSWLLTVLPAIIDRKEANKDAKKSTV